MAPQSKSLQSFYGSGKTTEELQASWDRCYLENHKRSLRGQFHHQMPSNRPGQRRAAPGDRAGNKAVEKEHQAHLASLRKQAEEEWKAESQGCQGEGSRPTKVGQERRRPLQKRSRPSMGKGEEEEDTGLRRSARIRVKARESKA
mmetsp:Transcript_7084/g.8163  ORF Transcript_7084/g.8163 Transcript_7084/m.8163 type:complete len:145 (+) Transcript_7084:728-1162(+)|eukprot:CAMPEP_0197855772 /NCGR_PEP_ID=MMETSP1438-20131217/27264_1 /TAXON_ID=1461541 /ORGANISM="Pterosperma sp., Strain CCMP1384" /LENGTH=144 /DNA_ID=CAMNT_0043471005 /DNA_START=723 /DNA_END=1157 /DNA_ORIENTATION=-